MKSNEEFIAGIYEKAAFYTEENNTKILRVNFAARAAKIAAMFAVCLGLAGVGAVTLGNSGNTPQGGDAGIALSSEEGTPFHIPEPRVLPELNYLAGEVETVDAENKMIFLRVQNMESEETSDGAKVLVVVRFAEDVDLIDKLCKGMQIKVGGAAFEGGYLTPDSEYTLLLVTREQDFFVWSQESGTYIRPDYISDENK